MIGILYIILYDVLFGKIALQIGAITVPKDTDFLQNDLNIKSFTDNTDIVGRFVDWDIYILFPKNHLHKQTCKQFNLGQSFLVWTAKKQFIKQ